MPSCQRHQLFSYIGKWAGGAVLGEVRVAVVEDDAVGTGIVVESRCGRVGSIADGYSRYIRWREVGLAQVALAVPAVARSVL